jgi:hypothetical protein
MPDKIVENVIKKNFFVDLDFFFQNFFTQKK